MVRFLHPEVYLIFNIEIIFFSLIVFVYFYKPSIELSYILTSGFVASYLPQLLLPFVKSNAAIMSLVSASRFYFISLLPLLFIRRSSKMLNVITALSVIDSIWIIINFLLTGRTIGNYGIMLVSTMDACFIGIMFPLLIELTRHVSIKLKLFILSIPIIAVLITTSSTGIGAIVIGLIILNVGKSYLYFIVPGLLAILAAIINPLLLSDSLRFICWEWSMTWWMDNANILFGTGLGTFANIGPMIQVMTGNQIGNWYTMMHNEWLQILFELGVVGLILCSFFYIRLLIMSSSRPYLFATIIVYGATSFIAMPMHYPLTMLVGALLIRECYE